MKKENYPALFLLLWSGAAILLPTTRALGLVHWSWWLCLMPFLAMTMCGFLVVIFVVVEGVDDRGALEEEEALPKPKVQNDSDSMAA